MQQKDFLFEKLFVRLSKFVCSSVSCEPRLVQESTYIALFDRNGYMCFDKGQFIFQIFQVETKTYLAVAHQSWTERFSVSAME